MDQRAAAGLHVVGHRAEHDGRGGEIEDGEAGELRSVPRLSDASGIEQPSVVVTDPHDAGPVAQHGPPAQPVRPRVIEVIVGIGVARVMAEPSTTAVDVAAITSPAIR